MIIATRNFIKGAHKIDIWRSSNCWREDWQGKQLILLTFNNTENSILFEFSFAKRKNFDLFCIPIIPTGHKAICTDKLSFMLKRLINTMHNSHRMLMINISPRLWWIYDFTAFSLPKTASGGKIIVKKCSKLNVSLHDTFTDVVTMVWQL